MKIKNLFNKHNVKTLTLAGLMGLMPSCKETINEPESTQQKTEIHTKDKANTPSNQQNTFMSHIDNIDDAVFYEPTEDRQNFKFYSPSVNQRAYYFINTTDVADIDNCILYPFVFTCTESNDSVAKYMGRTYWDFHVEWTGYNGHVGSWDIANVTDEDRKNIYDKMTDQELADLAKDRIKTRSPNETTHRDSVYNKILTGQGQWELCDPVSAVITSKGGSQNLRHSDFGTFRAAVLGQTGDSPVLTETGIFNSVYSGGIKDYEIPKEIVQPITIKGTAFGVLSTSDDQELVVSTNKNSATYTIDVAQNETIVMPFNNWYKITIIRTNNSVVSYLENTNNNIAQTWLLPNQDLQETNYREGIQPNGLFATDGFYGDSQEDGDQKLLTGLSVNYYGDNYSSDIEVIVQGYRIERPDSGKIKFVFAFGATNRAENTGISTGLNEIKMNVAARNRQR